MKRANPLPQDLDQTVDLPKGNASVALQDGNLGDSIPELQSPSTSANITQKFDESTRKLLRDRLIVAATTTLGFLVLIKVVGLLFGDTTFYDLLTRLTASIILATAAIYLYRNSDVSFQWLRAIEGVIGVALSVECIWVLVSETQKRIAAGELDSLPALFMAISFAFAIFIAIYGMFIPSNWRRSAAITCLSAFVPTVAALVLRHCYPVLQQVEEFPGVAAPTLTMVMALVATQAAHVVHFRVVLEASNHWSLSQLLNTDSMAAV